MSQIEAMYRQHGPALLRYLDRTFGRSCAAEDLLHETFVRAMASENWRQFASPRAFLFGIARNVGLAASRSAKLRLAEPFQDAQAESKDTTELQSMREAMAQLPEQIRRTLELRLHDQLTYEEIADVLDLPIGTVRSRLHTALKLLRAEMEK